MRVVLMVVAALLLARSSGMARIGETPEHCDERYGTPIREVKGWGTLCRAATYSTNGVTVTAVFVTRPYQQPAAGFIFYAKYNGDADQSSPSQFSRQERDALLATVPGRWESGAKPRRLEPPGRVKRLVSPDDGIINTRGEEAGGVVEQALNALLPDVASHSPRAQNRRNCGARYFAFDVRNGLAIVAYDTISAIAEWSAALLKSKPAPTAPDARFSKPDPLERF